ncbi:MAG: hypothetical protein ACJAV1_004016, partial [Paraglaciecola sp.]
HIEQQWIYPLHPSFVVLFVAMIGRFVPKPVIGHL